MNQPEQPISLEKFAQEDAMMKEFYTSYFEENHMPLKSEIYANARFFAVFSVESSKREIPELAKVMGQRLECYVWMIKKLGYKPGRALVKRSISGLNEMLSSIFFVVKTE